VTGDTPTSDTGSEVNRDEYLRIGVLSPLLVGTFFGPVLAGFASVGRRQVPV
jgi:hypothetical protein